MGPTKVWSIPSSESSTISRRTSRPPSPSREKLRDKDSKPSPPSEVVSTVKSPSSTPELLTSEESASTSPSPSPTTKRTLPVPKPNSKVKSPPAVTPSISWKTRENSWRDTTTDPARLSDDTDWNSDIFHLNNFNKKIYN